MTEGIVPSIPEGEDSGQSQTSTTSGTTVLIQPILYEDHKYKPPVITPKTREEAIYLLACCGFYALAEPIHILGAFSSVLRNRDAIRENGYRIQCWDNVCDERILKRTDTLVKRWLVEKPLMFSGLSDLAGWLQHTCGLAGSDDAIFKWYTQKRSFARVTEVPYEDLSPADLDDLADELWQISCSSNWSWTLDTYFGLVLQYAKEEKKVAGKKGCDATLKKRLLARMEKGGLRKATIPSFFTNDPEEWSIDDYAALHVNGIWEALENDATSFPSIISQIKRKTKPEGSKATGAFLKAGKRFNINFFIRFCVAYVEVSLASLKAPDAELKVTSWVIYKKMRELNQGEHIDPVGRDSEASEKDQRSQVTQIISNCKNRFKEYDLPAPSYRGLNKDEVSQCIGFFKNYPSITKFYSELNFIQPFIKQLDETRS